MLFYQPRAVTAALRFPPKEMEEFNSIVSTAERMNKQVAVEGEETSHSELQALGSIHHGVI